MSNITAQHIVNRIDRALDALNRKRVAGWLGNQAHPAARPCNSAYTGSLLRFLTAEDIDAQRRNGARWAVEHDRLMKARGAAQDIRDAEENRLAAAAERAASRKAAAERRRMRNQKPTQCPTCGSYAYA